MRRDAFSIILRKTSPGLYFTDHDRLSAVHLLLVRHDANTFYFYQLAGGLRLAGANTKTTNALRQAPVDVWISQAQRELNQSSRQR